MKKWLIRLFILVVILGAIIGLRVSGLSQYLTLEQLKAQQASLHAYYESNQLQTLLIFFASYVGVTALSIPGATIFTLAAGMLFGLGLGTVVVSFASSMGATLAFLISRLVLRDFIERKFHTQAKKLNEGIKKEGAFYLFSLRLLPVFPFFMVNLVMGLTRIGVATFYGVSQLGMLPGTLVYVNAGTQLANIQSARDILSFKLLLSFTLLGLLPLISKKILSSIKAKKTLKSFKRPRRYDYNVVVIGGGSGGLVSSYIASILKAKTALIEKGKMGGDCLNTGCVPSKALIRSARVLGEARSAKDLGFRKIEVEFEFSEIMERVQRVIETVEPHDSVERYTSLGVECIQGEAFIQTPYEVRVGSRVLTTRAIIVATGASPRVPPLPGLKETRYYTSENLWKIRSLPKRLLILGGGPISCELAQAFSRFGSQVTILERGPHLLSREDSDAAASVTAALTADGVKILTGHDAVSIRTEGTQRSIIARHDGQERAIEFDEILVALGREAHVKGFGLEELGVKLTDHGTIETNEFLQATYPNLYACGDVAGPYQFTHFAAHQAWYAAVNSLFSPFKKFKTDYRVIPRCTFTDPEVASVGITEAEAKKEKIPFEITRYEMDDLDRAITDGKRQGFVKVVTAAGKDRILGVTIVAAEAGELITEYVAAMKYGYGLNKILSLIHAYPTLSEANRYAAGNWKKARSPEKLLSYVGKFHRFRRNAEKNS
jgi:pyruvate/2-oxoglutarate dehydrogenase complex dihydrolipoamide dehydrogenase (E3) component/uncharacterized membrane protein YdjX (TVP38/TMEM64 family)